MKAYFLTVMICGSMLLSLSAFGAVILVPTDQPTIAAAIAAATIMDQIAIEPGTYTESGLVITQDLTISAQNWGDPADHIIQADVTAGTATDRIFSVTSGRVTLRGLTIRHGNVVGDGGAVLCSGAATILSVSNCVFVDNIAVAGAGGAVYSDQAVSDFWQCDIFGNTAAGGGGGVYMIGGSTNFSQNTVSGNLAADGGGMYFFDCAAWTTNCTVSANTATGNGGGISFNFSAPGIDSYTTNSTVSGNNANQGGGISVDIAAASTATLRHLTVASNVAGNDGGGIIAGGAAAPDLQACIIANNNAPMDVDISGTVNSLDYNLIEDITGATITGVTTNNITGGDPNIGPLADNGGSTMTHVLLTGSIALDQIPSVDLLETWDQRQAPRPQNVDGDMGAYELFVDDWGAITINCWQSAPPSNDTIQVMVGFNQLAIDFDDVSDLIITTTGTLTYTNVTGFMGGMNFAVTLEGVSGTGTITISVNPASDVVTPFGAPLTSSVTSDVFLSDNDPPTLSISAPSSANTVAGPVEYTVTYSGEDTVTLSDTDITLDITGDVLASVVVAPLGGSEWLVTLLGITGTGTLGFTIDSGTASDTAGNLALGASSVPVVVVSALPVAVWPLALVLAAAGALAARRRRHRD